MENLKSYTILVLIGIVIILLVLTKCSEPALKQIETTIYKPGRIDTVIQERIVYSGFKGKGKVKVDDKPIEAEFNGKAYIVNPFVAKLDTAIGKDSFRIKYSYPLNEFELNYKRYDSIQFITRTDTLKITNTIIETESKPWYEYLIYAIGGFTVGYVLGK